MYPPPAVSLKFITDIRIEFFAGWFWEVVDTVAIYTHVCNVVVHNYDRATIITNVIYMSIRPVV